MHGEFFLRKPQRSLDAPQDNRKPKEGESLNHTMIMTVKIRVNNSIVISFVKISIKNMILIKILPVKEMSLSLGTTQKAVIMRVVV